jgi:hypothetical protein
VAEAPTPEQLADQIRRLKIEDIVLSTISTLGQLTYVKIDAKELDQARLAIDAIAALLPTLEGHLDEQVRRDFIQLLANLRLSFANTVSASGAEPQRDETEAETEQESGSGTEPRTPGEGNATEG